MNRYTALLQGLQRMLRSKRKEWEMSFLSSPQEALELMQRQCFDIVVVDMRMPELNGAELLKKVKETCPRSIRIILSGQADLPTIMSAISSSHQYLSKPCDPDLLKATIDRAVILRKLTKNQDLEEFVSQLVSLPAQPKIYDAVIQELANEKPSLDLLSILIARDLSMSAKILQLVNSSFFGSKRDVFNIYEAVGILGVEILKRLVLSFQIFSRGESAQLGGLDLEALNSRAVAVGNFAVKVAMVEGLDASEVKMFPTTGLLHDIGKIILAMYSPERYRDVLACREEGEAWLEKEQALFGTTHSEVGGYLLGLWGLPSPIVDAASHHCVGQPLLAQKFTVIDALRAANYVVANHHSVEAENLEDLTDVARYREVYSKLRAVPA